METVAFYSYKGGVGRTLLVANTAQFLAMSGRCVVGLDLDLEAPGLHQKLGNRDVVNRAASGELPGAVDELLAILENEPRKSTLRRTAITVDLPSGTSGSLVLIPAGSAPSHAYWVALERLNNTLRTQRQNGGLPEAVLELQARIAEEFAPEFLLLDSRTGITELGGLATSLLADRVVCLTTTAPESIDGTCIVAEALRAAPRLSSQQPLRIDFLVTRVTSRSDGPSIVARLKHRIGDSVGILPHDSAMANEERVLSGWSASRPTTSDDNDRGGMALFSATLSWIAKSFPGHQQDAERARRRMEAVYFTWQELTRAWDRLPGVNRRRDAWPENQLRERVRFGTSGNSRRADIVAYDGSADDAKPLIIIEYADSEDRDAVAQWWLSETRVPVVAVLSDNRERRLYSHKAAWDSRARHSERWDLPLPHDFIALSDPTDVSVDALLDAVRCGHPDYLERIVTEWVRCSATTLHGGAPWKPQLARKIVDALARVDDVELARRVLWAASPDPFHRGMWLGDGDDWLDDQVLAELFAPLLWRLPPEASVEILGESRRRGMPFHRPSGLLAVGLLARDMLALRYDPDVTFRVEGQRILDASGVGPDSDHDRGIYALTSAFEHTEISFEISSDLPPLVACRDFEGESKGQTPDIAALVAARIATGSLITTGLLGDYQPDQGRVILYSTAIDECANKLALRPRHVGSVTLIHETLHALAHLGRDLDGRMWPEFALPAANHPLFQPSVLHETFAQYFTYQQILRLGDPALQQAFDAMSSKQAPAYRVWRRLRDLPVEDVRSWFMSVRRGLGGASPSLPVLVNIMRDET
jgi:MinD-like ATPase involved in chromosome partitioning or flagellar assembly